VGFGLCFTGLSNGVNMISANVSRQIAKKVTATTALITSGLERVVSVAVAYHGSRLVASIDAAERASEKAFEHAHILQAAASTAFEQAALADIKVDETVQAVEAELDALGIYNA
jgi:hypothetical protein